MRKQRVKLLYNRQQFNIHSGGISGGPISGGYIGYLER